MKQIALILILLSSILTTFTLMIDELYNYIDSFSMFYPAVDIYLRYHMITLLMGLFIFAFYAKDQKDKTLLILSSCMIFFTILLKEFGQLQVFNIFDLFLTIAYTIFLSIYIWSSRSDQKEITNYTKRRSIIFMVLYTFFYIFVLIRFRGSFSQTRNINYRFLQSICYLLFHYGIFLYFKRIYGLSFNHTYEVNLKD